MAAPIVYRHPTRVLPVPSGLGGGIGVFGATVAVPSVGSTGGGARWTGESFERYPLNFTTPGEVVADAAYINIGFGLSTYVLKYIPGVGSSLIRQTAPTQFGFASIAVGSTGPGKLFVVREAGVDQLYMTAPGLTQSGVPLVPPLLRKNTGTSFLWTAVGGTWPASAGNAPIGDVVSFDDGSGEALTVAVEGSAPLRLVGGVWTPMGSLSPAASGSGTIRGRDLEITDRGQGPELWLAGDFEVAGGTHIARWNGSQWQAAGTFSHPVARLTGFGSEIFAAGSFTAVDGIATNRAAHWDGTWHAIAGPVERNDVHFVVQSLGGTPALFAMDTVSISTFMNAPLAESSILKQWNGTDLGEIGTQGADRTIYAFEKFDDGTGEKLWAGGFFLTSGNAITRGLATFDGTSWSDAPGEFGTSTAEAIINTLAKFDDGSGEALYAGGQFRVVDGQVVESIAKYDGSTWQSVGGGVTDFLVPPMFPPFVLPAVNALAVYDDGTGPALYAGGRFLFAGGVPVTNLAKWDGTQWSAVGGPLVGDVTALEVWNGELWVGGKMSSVDGVATIGLARWNGSTWSTFGGGVSGPAPFVNALHVHNDGTGEAMYITGSFDAIDGVLAAGIAKYDGVAFSALGSGLTDPNFAVGQCLASFDEGDGSALVVGGIFRFAGGLPAQRIARWKNGIWSTFGTGLDVAPTGNSSNLGVSAWALESFDSGNGDCLYVGGDFLKAGDRPSSHFARWQRVATDPTNAILDDAAESLVGVGAGGPYDLLAVNGRFGNGHRVNLAIGESITFELRQAPNNAVPAPFAIFGMIGTPTAAERFTLPLGLGDLVMTPCPLDPANPVLFTLADAFGIPGCAPILPAAATAWSFTVPGGLPAAASFAVQGIMYDPAAPFGLAKTNGVLVIVD